MTRKQNKKINKKKSSSKFSFFKQTKIIIALIFVIGFAGIGVKQLTNSKAATDPWISLAQDFSCPTNALGIPAQIQEGVNGNCTKLLKYVLINFTANKNLTVDIYFGPATTTAVKNVQKNFGLAQDGIVGNNTWAAIIKIVQLSGAQSNDLVGPTSLGVAHGTGSYVASTKEEGVNGPKIVPSWLWSSSRGDSKTQYLQFGPYRNMAVKYGDHGFVVCYQYSVDNGQKGYIPYTPNYVNAYMDIAYIRSNTRVVTGIYSQLLKIEGLTTDGYKKLHNMCYQVPLKFGFYNGMEYRLKITWTDGKNVSFNLISTNVNPY